MPLRIKLSLVAVLLALVAVYQPGLSGGFVLDDLPNIVDNPQTDLRQLSPELVLRSLFSSDSGPLGRPLSMFSFALERYFSGLNPFSFKLTNLIIHLINTLLVFFLTRGLLRRFRARYPQTAGMHIRVSTLALLITAAWALTPINLTAVLYVVQRMESLATLFMLAGLLAYLHGRSRMEQGEQRAGRLWVVGGLTLGTGLGVLAKESAIMLPLYALLTEWMLFGFGKKNSPARRFLTWLYCILLLLPGVIGLLLFLPNIFDGSAYANRPFGLSERLWTESRVIWHYLWWTMAPSIDQLSLFHDAFPLSRGPLHPWTTLLSALGLGGLLISALLLRKRSPLVAFGILWFFVMHLLVSTVLPLEPVYEHRNYMATLGVFIGLFGGIFYHANTVILRRASVIVAGVLIIAHGALTFLRAQEWSNPIRLAQFEAVCQAESPRANYEQGRSIIAYLSPPPSSPLYALAIDSFERAAKLPRAGLLPFQALIFTAARNGQEIREEWWTAMQSYIQSNPLTPQDIGALYALNNGQIKGSISLDTDKLGQIIQSAHHHNQDNFSVNALYANYALNIRRDLVLGHSLLQAATALAPKNPQAWINLIRFQISSGQTAAAEVALSRLRELNRFGILSGQIQSLRNQIHRGRRSSRQ
jgi:hypothetical protein